MLSSNRPYGTSSTTGILKKSQKFRNHAQMIGEEQQRMLVVKKEEILRKESKRLGEAFIYGLFLL